MAPARNAYCCQPSVTLDSFNVITVVLQNDWNHTDVRLPSLTTSRTFISDYMCSSTTIAHCQTHLSLQILHFDVLQLYIITNPFTCLFNQPCSYPGSQTLQTSLGDVWHWHLQLRHAALTQTVSLQGALSVTLYKFCTAAQDHRSDPGGCAGKQTNVKKQKCKTHFNILTKHTRFSRVRFFFLLLIIAIKRSFSSTVATLSAITLCASLSSAWM